MGKVAFMTLGCKVNQDETDSIMELFQQKDYEIVDFSEEADVYVINTCTVTQVGSKKSRQMIRRAHRLNPQALIAVTGCYSQTASEEVAKIPGVGLIVGNNQKHNMVTLVEQRLEEQGSKILVAPRHELNEFHSLPLATLRQRHRATLKIQEGCDNFCTYCIVPYARGPIRSKELGEVILDCEKLVQEGYKEVVLTGIHLGSYGRDLDSQVSLADVVNSLDKITGLDRVRLSSVEPTDFNTHLLTAIKSSRNICNHFHVPLQSGCDKILDLMGRKYTTDLYLQVINELRNLKKDVAITTDIMVGFPGETQTDFDITMNLVKKANFSDMHVFKYSIREGTPASKFNDQIPNVIKEQRSTELMNLGLELKKEFINSFIGNKVEVLFEKKSDEYIEGHTSNYIEVRVKGDETLLGKIREVEITEIIGHMALGKLI